MISLSRAPLARFALIGFACALLSSGAALAETDRYGTNSRIVFRNDTAPGLGAAEQVVDLDHFTVGSNGNVLVVGSINGGARAVWFGAPDLMTMIYRDDQPLFGFEPRGDLGTLQMARMSPGGERVAFLTDDADTSRVFTHIAGMNSLERIGSNHRYRQVSIANDGALVAGMGLTYEFEDPINSFTIYSVGRGAPGYFSSFVSEQLMIPGFGVNVRYCLEATVNCDGPISYQSMVANGQYLALVGLVEIGYKAGSWDDRGALYFNGTDTSGDIVLFAGQEAVGAPSGYQFVDYGYDENARLGRASVNDDGGVVFQWETESNGDIWTGLWSFSSRTKTLVVGEGDPIANRPGQTVRPNTYRTLVPGGSGGTQLWNLPQSTGDGDIVFPGEILETGNPAVFRYADGGVEVLAEAGQPFENGSPYYWAAAAPLPANDAPFMTPYLNALGQVLLWGNVEQGAESVPGLSPWIIDPEGTVAPIVLPGDTIDFGAGDHRSVAPQSLHDAATARWYGGTVLSSAGHVLTQVQSSAGWGILYAEPDAPVSHTPDVVVSGNQLGIRLLPHPFQGQGVIQLGSRNREPATISIYDTAGRLVRRLEARIESEGSATIHWDGRGQSGSSVASGVYLLRVEQGVETVSRKLVLVR